jgi:xylose isomerase
LLLGHIGGMDTCARALLAAAKMLEDGVLEAPLRERYEAWDTAEGKRLLAGDVSLAEL